MNALALQDCDVFYGKAQALHHVSIDVAAGEVVSLIGRNGAGKSTLLRVAKGLVEPSRGRVERGGEVALLLQNPGDYLIHDHAVDDAGAGGVLRAGLAGREDANPRDLSGGERQRLALAIVAAGRDTGRAAAAVCLDEPTRGMDRSARAALVTLLRELAERGTAVLVATHDAELAAMFAERVVMLGDGAVIADGPPHELLAGGWYFATETARILGGAGGALLPADGAALLRREQAVVA
jgi:ABC-type multidrug transport system ATPase subunit